jgi:hypothetical protein
LTNNKTNKKNKTNILEMLYMLKINIKFSQNGLNMNQKLFKIIKKEIIVYLKLKEYYFAVLI